MTIEPVKVPGRSEERVQSPKPNDSTRPGPTIEPENVASPKNMETASRLLAGQPRGSARARHVAAAAQAPDPPLGPRRYVEPAGGGAVGHQVDVRPGRVEVRADAPAQRQGPAYRDFGHAPLDAGDQGERFLRRCLAASRARARSFAGSGRCVRGADCIVAGGGSLAGVGLGGVSGSGSMSRLDSRSTSICSRDLPRMGETHERSRQSATSGWGSWNLGIRSSCSMA